MAQDNRPNPIMTLIILVFVMGSWGTAATKWFEGDDHWALFWFAWAVTGANMVLVRTLRYRKVM